jgi:hypothetical protein
MRADTVVSTRSLSGLGQAVGPLATSAAEGGPDGGGDPAETTSQAPRACLYTCVLCVTA